MVKIVELKQTSYNDWFTASEWSIFVEKYHGFKLKYGNVVYDVYPIIDSIPMSLAFNLFTHSQIHIHTFKQCYTRPMKILHVCAGSRIKSYQVENLTYEGRWWLQVFEESPILKSPNWIPFCIFERDDF